MRVRHPAARHRLAAVALAGAAALASQPLAPAPAQASPPAGPAAAVAAAAEAAAPEAASARVAPEPALPVAVTVTALEPRDVRAGATVTVTAVLRNTGREATGPLRVRLQRGVRMTTRGQLERADTDEPPTTAAATTPEDVPSLPAGRSRTVTYRATTDDLAFGNLGVYPVALSAVDEDGVEVGREQTLVPFFPPDTDPVATRVALFWPLLDRPHRLLAPAGQPALFDDDLLARAVSRGGRLDRLLSIAEQAPGTVRLTIAVDPETVEELQVMASGYQVVGPGGRGRVAGRGGKAASAWLARLRAIAPKHLLLAVPYGDPDLVALERGSLGALARPRAADVEATARVLGERPTTTVVWPPDGQLTDTALDDVVSEGVSAVVVDPTGLPGGPSPDSGPTPSGVSPLPALGGRAVALVPDRTLQRVVDAGGARAGLLPGGPRLAEQRVLAELAMITAEQPNGDARTLVVAPPRRWDPTGQFGSALLDDLALVPWLSSTTASEAAGSTRPVDRASLVYPAAAQRREISSGQVQQVGAVQTLVTDFRSALSNSDANTVLDPYGDALRRSGSSAWRGNQQAGRVFAARLRRQIDALRSRVTMTPPSSGVYTLTSSESPLVVTLQNGLDVPVKVRVRMDVPPGFAVEDAGDVQIDPGRKRTLQLTASVQRTGTFAVRGRLVTPAQGGLGQDITLSVRSTAYGGLALGVTGLAFAVLVAAVLVRLFRRLRGRDPGPPAAAGSPADRSLP